MNLPWIVHFGGSMGRFFGLFSDAEHVFNEFRVTHQGEILAAVYVDEDYSGEAAVLWRGEDGQLYEIYGFHCSCFGLENQWSPELVQVDELRERMRRDGSEFAQYVISLLPLLPES
jgi:hypothetical protein